ncbi:MAG: hypothetical protein II343_03480, partial [Clostridia bacterium]|nr:hypothetical protein [Clostridia bacterium]
ITRTAVRYLSPHITTFTRPQPTTHTAQPFPVFTTVIHIFFPSLWYNKSVIIKGGKHDEKISGIFSGAADGFSGAGRR